MKGQQSFTHCGEDYTNLEQNEDILQFSTGGKGNEKVRLSIFTVNV
jgi:hypothetical protein